MRKCLYVARWTIFTEFRRSGAACDARRRARETTCRIESRIAGSCRRGSQPCRRALRVGAMSAVRSRTGTTRTFHDERHRADVDRREPCSAAVGTHRLDAMKAASLRPSCVRGYSIVPPVGPACDSADLVAVAEGLRLLRAAGPARLRDVALPEPVLGGVRELLSRPHRLQRPWLVSPFGVAITQ